MNQNRYHTRCEWDELLEDAHLDAAIADELRRPRAMEHGLTGDQLRAALARRRSPSCDDRHAVACSLSRLHDGRLVETSLADRFTGSGRITLAVYWWKG